MYYVCSENKGADLRLCFRICKTLISHDAAQLPLSDCAYARADLCIVTKHIGPSKVDRQRVNNELRYITGGWGM